MDNNRSREKKEERFKRIATRRTQKILNYVRLLGNCSNRTAYSYKSEDIAKIFSAVDRELQRVKVLFSKPEDDFQL